MSTEKRLAERRPLIMYLDVLDKKTDQALGYLSDVSKTGLMFISLLPLETGTNWQVYIDIPEEFQVDASATQDNVINLSIESMWAKPSLNPALFCVGCRFKTISSADRSRLEMLSERLGFSQDLDVNRAS